MSLSRAALLGILFSTSPLYGQVSGFHEPFDGGGEHGGFHQEWGGSTDGTFEAGGFRIENNLVISPDLPPVQISADVFQKDVEGFGSFITTAEVENLDLGDLDLFSSADSSGRIQISHFNPGDLGHTVQLVELWDTPENMWDLIVLPGNAVETFPVPRSLNGATMRLEVIHRTSTDATSIEVRYDNDINDGAAGLHFGPFHLVSSANASEFSDSGFVFESVFRAVTGHSRANGLLKHLSLRPSSDMPGDFSRNEMLDNADIDLLNESIRSFDSKLDYDLTDDGLVDEADRIFWVHNLAQTYFGDANLDGEFASSDLINVFTGGEYEDGIEGNSGWATGDWNGDAEFTSSDLVLAFTDSGYEQGPQIAASVPEPNGWPLLLIALISGRRRVGL